MQKHSGLVVYPFQGGWSDVGSWNAAAELTHADAAGNRVYGQGRAIRSTGTPRAAIEWINAEARKAFSVA